MFEWFWEFLYGISKTLMNVCDLMMGGARALIGIDDILVNGEETDFLTYLLRSSYVSYAFGAVFSIAIIVLFIFAIIAIVRNTLKEQQNTTPLKILANVLKNILYFLAVPVLMLALTYFLNTFLRALNTATSGGDTSSIGSYLFVIFAKDAGLSEQNMDFFLTGALDYQNTDLVGTKIVLADFNYIMCWIVSGVILYNLAVSLVSFVERAISIVILYISAPFAIASSILDDGARYKAWRDQVISKFLSAYGILIAMNIYIMFCGLVVNDDISFFASRAANSTTATLNYMAKIFIVLGGALSMKKAHSLIGNLISSTAQSDINDPNNAAGRGLLGKMIRYSPLGIAGSTVGSAMGRKMSNLKDRAGNAILNAAGISTDYDTNRLNGTYSSKLSKDDESPSDSQNTQNPDYNNDQDLRLAFGDDNDKNNNSNNTNVNAPKPIENNNMNNIINNAENNNKKDNNNDDEDLR